MRRRFLIALLVLTLAREWLYLGITPPFQGPDEPGHFEYIALIYRLRRVPSPRPDTEIDPLLTRAINAAAASQRFELFHRVGLRRLSEQTPPVLAGPREAGYQTPTYYQALVPVYAALSSAGVLPQYYALAAASSLLALIVVAAAAGLARELFPEHPFAQAALPLLVAFWPTQTYMMARLNNDNLATAIGAVGLWLAVVVLRRGVSVPRGAALLAVGWLALNAKGTTLFVLPVLGLAGLLHYAGRLPPERRRAAWLSLGAAGGLGLLIGLGMFFSPTLAGWLLAAVEALPGASRGEQWLAGMLTVLSTGQFWQAERLAANRQELASILRTLWAAYGWGALPLAAGWYWLAALGAGLAGSGLLLGAFRGLLDRRAASGLPLALLVLGAAFGAAWVPLAARMVSDPFAAYWHGRSLLPTLPAVAAFLAAGWGQFLPVRWQGAGVRGLLGLLVLIDTAGLAFTVVRYFYG